MFSIGIAPAHPILMSEQSPRTTKLRHQYMHEVTSNHYDKLKLAAKKGLPASYLTGQPLFKFSYNFAYAWTNAIRKFHAQAAIA